MCVAARVGFPHVVSLERGPAFIYCGWWRASPALGCFCVCSLNLTLIPTPAGCIFRTLLPVHHRRAIAARWLILRGRVSCTRRRRTSSTPSSSTPMVRTSRCSVCCFSAATRSTHHSLLSSCTLCETLRNQSRGSMHRPRGPGSLSRVVSTSLGFLRDDGMPCFTAPLRPTSKYLSGELM